MIELRRNRVDVIEQDERRVVLTERRHPIVSLIFWFFAGVALLIVAGSFVGARRSHTPLIVAIYSVAIFTAVGAISGLESTFTVNLRVGALLIRRSLGPLRFDRSYPAAEVARISSDSAPGGCRLWIELTSGRKTVLTLFAQNRSLEPEAALLNQFLRAAKARPQADRA